MRRRALLRILGPLWLAMLCAAPAPALAAGKLRIDFIDVGQGDAALVTSPTGKTMLIDGGPREAGGELAAFVRRRTAEPLDLVLLTHRHADHLGGLATVVRGQGVRLFMDAAFPHPSAAYTALLRALDERHIPIRQAVAGRNIDLGGGAVVTLLGPPAPVIRRSRSDVNANSVVARLVFGKVAVLFMGDAEAPTEAWLLATGAPVQARVLKVAHHGSRYSSGARFLGAVGAEVAVVSVGARNGYGHPQAEALARLAKRPTTVYRTDVDGSISIETDGTGLEVKSARPRDAPVGMAAP